ncbi:unnamed protein product [Prorocentrum cordatum]|uniref:Pentacotripeptide-repeat region of PRORP domain-containing protein n=1 Tax=Prorocentrum cordatum TaxID=2364126 RepID=A0ABN9SYW7_9DINO|nr:unnamed protein product [Polarella glacialis]
MAGGSACEKGSQGLVLAQDDVDEVHGFALVSYNAGISACEKGQQWQPALALLSEMRDAKLEPDVISPTMAAPALTDGESGGSGLAPPSGPCEPHYNAGISACEKGEQWQRALALLSKMREAKLEPNGIPFSYNAAISACQKGKQWQRALSLLRDIRQMKLYPDLFVYGIVASMCEHGGQKKMVQSLTREMCGLIVAE